MALSTAPNDSEESRTMLQERLALFGSVCFFLYFGIAAITMVIILVIVPGSAAELHGPPFHLLPVLGSGVCWVICRRGTRPLRLLLLLDAGVTFMVGAGISLVLHAAGSPLSPALQATFGVTNLVVMRAVIVPGDWRRTLWISLLAVAPAVTAIVVTAAHGNLHLHPMWSILLPAWIAFAVVLASLTSHVIYRLRVRVREALTLGQYTLEEKIGEGGMGVVFRARHAMLRRRTVVKLLPQEKAGEANIARFEREVQLTSQLSSPNTVAIYDFGRTPAGIFYYAMEHLDGVDLEALVADDGPQPAARVIHILAGVCVALTEAHEQGLVHRDIKPSNVMLCRHGGVADVVKVLDFGLVKDTTATGGMRLTQADAVVGTPLYLSPEALLAPDSVDARSDLYAVGAIGIFLLTGRPVFEGRTFAEVSGHHIHTAPEPPSRRTPVPADLEEVLLACLAKPQEARPGDARALRARLLACAEAGRWTDEQARTWWRSH